MMYYYYVLAGVVGLIIGSFLNVCIYRLPLHKSIVSPPSSCPNCGNFIKPWHNIPVVSYALLGGRCAYCGQKISLRYPSIEALNAALYLLSLYVFGPTYAALVVMALMSAFVVITFIDYDHKEIPDEITLPGIVLGLVIGPMVLHIGWLNSVLGALAGGGMLFGAGLLGSFILKKESMGFGDVKLMAMVGAFIGWKLALISIFFGSLIGSVIGVSLIATKVIQRDDYIPFGPFLVAGCCMSIFCGQFIVGWYGGLG